jgi:predicted transcriptional regulator
MNPQSTVADILASGLTQTQLAGLIPCSQSQISSLLTGTRGTRISKRIGDRLEEIHAERCATEEAATRKQARRQAESSERHRRRRPKTPD